MVLILGLADFRVKLIELDINRLQSAGDLATLFKGLTSSSISFDPAIGQTQEKDQLQELFQSFHLTMGRASGTFTEILGIIFPKAIYKGMCRG